MVSCMVLASGKELLGILRIVIVPTDLDWIFVC
jgi:hypothetical protein